MVCAPSKVLALIANMPVNRGECHNVPPRLELTSSFSNALGMPRSRLGDILVNASSQMDYGSLRDDECPVAVVSCLKWASEERKAANDEV